MGLLLFDVLWLHVVFEMVIMMTMILFRFLAEDGKVVLVKLCSHCWFLALLLVLGLLLSPYLLVMGIPFLTFSFSFCKFSCFSLFVRTLLCVGGLV